MAPAHLHLCVCVWVGALTCITGVHSPPFEGVGTLTSSVFTIRCLILKNAVDSISAFNVALVFLVIGMPLSPCCLTLEGASHNTHLITHNATSRYAGFFI